jgi:hypothetical protein
MRVRFLSGTPDEEGLSRFSILEVFLFWSYKNSLSALNKITTHKSKEFVSILKAIMV